MITAGICLYSIAIIFMTDNEQFAPSSRLIFRWIGIVSIAVANYLLLAGAGSFK